MYIMGNDKTQTNRRRTGMKNTKFEQAFDKLLEDGCLEEIDKENLKEWLDRRALSLYKRDKRREAGTFEYTVMQYRDAICDAIIKMSSCSKDSYTGEELDWSLIGKYNNEEARKGSKQYKKRFAKMPTVDHKNAEPEPNFLICSWQTNDIKNDMTLVELKKWCELFLEFQGGLFSCPTQSKTN
jgi:hypothetical protein